MLPLFNTHLEALICFNRISTVGLCTKSVVVFAIYCSGKHAHTRNKSTQTHRNGKIGYTQLHSYTEKATSVFQREVHTGHFIRYTLPVQGT